MSEEKTACRTPLHEVIRTSLQAVTVLIAALALLGTAGYFTISSVVAQETRELRDQVLAMQINIAQIPAMQKSITDLRNELAEQSKENNDKFNAILKAIQESK